MKVIHRKELLSLAVQKMKKQALTHLFDGTGSIYNQVYLAECRWWIQSMDCVAIVTRDTGHHTSGWWKNPDYERCWHVSLSFPGGRKQKDIEKLMDLFFGEHKKWVWIEPPYSKEGKQAEVYHYRLFCDENWQPIKPRGEVYTKCFTERGWKSFSEVQHEKNQQDNEILSLQ